MAATYANATNQAGILKELYPDMQLPKDLVYPKNPMYALVKKDESPDGFAGKYIPVPSVQTLPQGRSSAFVSAQGNQTPTVVPSFFVYRVSNYQIVTIQNDLIEATANSVGAFVDEMKLQIDKGMKNLANNIASDLFRNGDGTIGQISAISTGVITLVDPNSVVQFEIGQVLISYSISSGTYTQSTSAASGFVIGVNRSTGTVTVSATQNGSAGTPTSWSTSFPNLAVAGDSVAVTGGATGSTGSFLKISGLAAWLNAPNITGSDSFWGVNRSADVTRLAGQYFNGSSESIEEALIDAGALTAREGGMPGVFICGFGSYGALEKALGSKVQYVEVKHEEADISFAGIKVHLPYGPVTVIPDRSCQALTGYLLDLDTWVLRSLNGAPHILTYGEEGLKGLRVGTADALEVRAAFYGNLICTAPAFNCLISLSA